MTRRKANGEGSIYQRKDGRWEGQLYVMTTAGYRKRKSVFGKSFAEAHEKLTKLKTQDFRGIPLPDKDWRIDEYLDYWLENAVEIFNRPLTARRHRSVVRLYLKPGLGNHRLSQLSVRTVQDYFTGLHRAGKPAASLHQIRKVLSAALTYAVRQELVFRNVARLVLLPSYAAAEAEHWTADDARRFLDVARTDPLYPMFVLLLLYGLRSGEVRGLRWCDVDTEADVLRIRQQVQRIDGQMRSVELKTRTSRRDEPLLPAAKVALDQQLEKQTRDRQAAGEAWCGTGTSADLVFTTRSGRPVEARNLFRSFRRICLDDDLRPIKLHGLRHTNATTQKSLNVHDRDIQAILGHGDVKTTGIYEHVDMASKRNALEKVEQRIFWRTLDGNRCRQNADILPSNQKTPARGWSFLADFIRGHNLGGSSQTRTGDTRLFSSPFGNNVNRFTAVTALARVRSYTWLIGCVAVDAAVNSP
ncbi:tyrosine-type recombinase/integrase [Amycolatopsis sp., V23-08]|uniref:Tyrosine-type recombinase/integrase n=1 Tax=Amycolatopsis heterodermiae TaxID=3110235 RepID=A0ABU5QZ18_9PSEU|nr:tyrosine-type recombinase/integrase [Amycolatopsis sp., V23-08]MEA5358734.1 tyrosine-type recombinase/integrase [Amycolatopsis sp., V23-08]